MQIIYNGSAHFWTEIRVEQAGGETKWFRYNDKLLSESGIPLRSGTQSCMLVYRRVEVPENSAGQT